MQSAFDNHFLHVVYRPLIRFSETLLKVVFVVNPTIGFTKWFLNKFNPNI